jgi:hypothetical protein
MLAFLAMALVAAEPQISADTTDAASLWAQCDERRVIEMAFTDQSAEAVANAIRVACAAEEQNFLARLTIDLGQPGATRILTSLRARERERVVARIAEIRGLADPARDEVESYGRCVGSRALALAAGGEPAEAIAGSAIEQCAAQEQAAQARLTREEGASQAAAIMPALREQMRREALRVIVARRGQ